MSADVNLRKMRRVYIGSPLDWWQSDMLVLSRKLNEQILIGDDIVLTIVDIRGDKVRLGIEAPAEIPVHRHEVYLALKRAESARADAGETSDQH